MATIVNKDGDLLNSSASFILHQVNCQGAMNSGVAKAIRTKWPAVYDNYKKICDIHDKEELLGITLPVTVERDENGKPTKTVLNLFSQHNYGYDGKRYTSYDALAACLERIASKCKESGIRSIALPYKMSCVRGGASWDVVMALINDAFKDLDITIEIWKL